MMLAGPSYCCIEECPAPRTRGGVLCHRHVCLERCAALTAEEQLRVYEYRRAIWQASRPGGG